MNLLVNKNAHRSYEIIDTFEAGMKLTGNEVKSLRSKHGSLKEAYVTFKKGHLVLTSAHIPPFQAQQASMEHYDPYHERILLVRKQEREKLRGSLKEKGHTLVPLRIYAKKRYIKIEIGIGRGKKKYDKRQDLRDRTSKRDAERAIKELS